MPQPHSPRPGSFRDRPLPGTFECLTMQINATIYPAAGTIRAVCIVRDPITGVEMDRMVLHTVPIEQGVRDFRADVEARLGHMLYLAGMNDQGQRIVTPAS